MVIVLIVFPPDLRILLTILLSSTFSFKNPVLHAQANTYQGESSLNKVNILNQPDTNLKVPFTHKVMTEEMTFLYL